MTTIMEMMEEITQLANKLEQDAVEMRELSDKCLAETIRISGVEL